MDKSKQNYVRWLRDSGPYVNAHRERTFVVQCSCADVSGAHFAQLLQDIALLHSLNVRLVIVYSADAQIDAALERRGIAPRYEPAGRVTDEASMEAAREAIGALGLHIDSLLSMGLANAPVAAKPLAVISGNFVTARPIGVREGIDYMLSGVTRRVMSGHIATQLAGGAIVVVPPIGFSPTGEAFTLNSQDLAVELAIELNATKLLLIGEDLQLNEPDGSRLGQLTLEQARDALVRKSYGAWRGALQCAVRACMHGVLRTHLLDVRYDGSVLLELFTRDGAGTLISAAPYEDVRRATIEDVGGILELIAPLERSGELVRRSREKLETEIGWFHIMERDGAIIACAAGYRYTEANATELACLAVHPEYRKSGRAYALLEVIENETRAAGIRRLFVLTTHTAHWFLEHGFRHGTLDALPIERQQLFNYSRNSHVLFKELA